MRRVIIVGGGLAGLVTAIQLAKAGIQCTAFEKKSYPFHRVCGEYVSNEAMPFLERSKLYPVEFSPPRISRFQLSAVSGKQVVLNLDLGGFGISRFSFDHFLYEEARSHGVDFRSNTEVTGIDFSDDHFTVKTNGEEFTADLVIATFGKRSRLDHVLGRAFLKKRSPYAGIKYHIRTIHPQDVISLHNFPGGYCGVSRVESGITNLCYLTHRDQLRATGDIKALEEEFLFKNPLLKYIFRNSDFLLPRAEVINEISFEEKTPVQNHILFAGDAAGMIAPLCGNGMAMAIHSAKIVSELALSFCHKQITRAGLEKEYAHRWKRNFSQRLWKGRQIQNLFGSEMASDIAVNLAVLVKPLARFIVRNTHGQAF